MFISGFFKQIYAAQVVLWVCVLPYKTLGHGLISGQTSAKWRNTEIYFFGDYHSADFYANTISARLR